MFACPCVLSITAVNNQIWLQGFAQLGGVAPGDAQLLHRAAGVKTNFDSLWALSDLDADSKLSEMEFVLFMHLLKAERKGASLPKQLSLPQVKPHFDNPIRLSTQICKQRSVISSKENYCCLQTGAKAIIGTYFCVG